MLCQPNLLISHKQMGYGGYFCPQCNSKFCELPTDCRVSSANLYYNTSFFPLCPSLPISPLHHKSLPEKQICGLTLVSSPHLARSYHHLFPVPIYTEIKHEYVHVPLPPPLCSNHTHPHQSTHSFTHCNVTSVFYSDVQNYQAPFCYACMMPLQQEKSVLVLKCPKCNKLFCYDCDIFIHESLHNCPGCENGLAP